MPHCATDGLPTSTLRSVPSPSYPGERVRVRGSSARRNALPMPRFAVILPAAGSSTRYAGPRNKLLETLGGQTVLARSIAAFQSRPDVTLIVIPTKAPLDLAGEKITLCPGGPSRAHSVHVALQQIPHDIASGAVH